MGRQDPRRHGFFTVDVWTGSGLTRFAVLFIIELSTRRVEIAGITSEPDAAWMSQVSRNITDVSDGFLTGKRFLIHDRDPLFTVAFRETPASAGPTAAPFPESQRARGALRTERQRIMSGPHDSRR